MDTSQSLQTIIKKLPTLAMHFRLASESRPTRAHPHVLVIEDQLFSRRLLQSVLHPLSTVIPAETVTEGLKLYLAHAPDIVLLDIDLQGDNGHILAQVIKTLDPESYIVMVTASNSIKDINTAQTNQVEGYIVKPFNKSKIEDTIETYYKKHPERRKGALHV